MFFRSSVAGLVLDDACEPGTWGWGGKVLRAQLEVSSVVCNELGAVAPNMFWFRGGVVVQARVSRKHGIATGGSAVYTFYLI
jgi:hypothetical protein